MSSLKSKIGCHRSTPDNSITYSASRKQSRVRSIRQNLRKTFEGLVVEYTFGYCWIGGGQTYYQVSRLFCWGEENIRYQLQQQHQRNFDVGRSPVASKRDQSCSWLVPVWGRASRKSHACSKGERVVGEASNPNHLSREVLLEDIRCQMTRVGIYTDRRRSPLDRSRQTCTG